jgi:predicted nucleotidyltransferase
MTEIEKAIRALAVQYGIQIFYSFGSRAEEAQRFVRGDLEQLARTSSDLDMAIKPSRPLTIEEKVEIAVRLEDLFGVSRVDLLILPEVRTFVALEAVIGELIFAEDDTFEAEYQLYIMRKAAELLPYERERRKAILAS